MVVLWIPPDSKGNSEWNSDYGGSVDSAGFHWIPSGTLSEILTMVVLWIPLDSAGFQVEL